MKYRVGEKVAFRVQAPIQENKSGPRRRGEYGPQNCGIGTVKSVVESENSYILSMAGMEYTVSEDEILGKASWNAESGKWQIDPM
ncbi:MAG TPA: hypothetical protein VL361_11890 [Candidatus Limnocylindrales bacterium]|jgi:hypothetical protein|nr:hypothetical protein [Candidatus Limnocylindrales bacterium]